jgi:hypothetical protein
VKAISRTKQFSGDLNPDVDAAIAELRQAGYKVERLYPPVLHPLDAFLDVEFDEPTSYAGVEAIWAQIDAIVEPHHGLVEGVELNYIPHLRLVTN